MPIPSVHAPEALADDFRAGRDDQESVRILLVNEIPQPHRLMPGDRGQQNGFSVVGVDALPVQARGAAVQHPGDVCLQGFGMGRYKKEPSPPVCAGASSRAGPVFRFRLW